MSSMLERHITDIGTRMGRQWARFLVTHLPIFVPGMLIVQTNLVWARIEDLLIRCTFSAKRKILQSGETQACLHIMTVQCILVNNESSHGFHA